MITNLPELLLKISHVAYLSILDLVEILLLLHNPVVFPRPERCILVVLIETLQQIAQEVPRIHVTTLEALDRCINALLRLEIKS